MKKWILNPTLYFYKLIFLLFCINLTSQIGNANNRDEISPNEIDLLIEKAWTYRSQQIDSMNHFVDEALMKSRDIHYLKGEGKSLNLKGFGQFVLGNHSLAIEYLKHSERILIGTNEQKCIAQNKNFLGLTYWAKGALDKAIIYQLEFLQLGKELEDDIILADANLNIGAIYKSCQEYNLAEEYIQKSLQSQRQIKNEEGIGYCLHHLAGVYQNLKQPQKSYEYYLKAIAVWKEIGDNRGLGYTYSELGSLALSMNHDNTLFVLEKAIKLIELFEQGAVHAAVLYNIGEYHFINNDWEKAEDFFQKSLEIAIPQNVHNTITDNAAKLASIFENKNNLRKANEYLHLQLVYQDSLDAKNQKKTKDWLIAKNELEQERNEHDNLKTKEIAQQELLNKQRIIVFCLFIILVFTGLFTLFFYKNQQKSNLVNQQLRTLNKSIQEKNEAIKKQSEQLQKVNDELENFSSIASHDMKEPLRTIVTFGKILKEQIPKEEDNLECVNFIVDAAERMSDLLQNLLDYARSGGQKKVLKTVNLNNIMLITQNNLMIKIRETNALILVDENFPKVMADKEALIQLFQNLISNGMKFQPKGQQPIIEM